MAVIEDFAGNCGMEILHDLAEDPSWDIAEFRDHYLDCRDEDRGISGIVAFTDTVDRGYGKALAEYIEKHKLGEVTRHGPVENPNSGNEIEAWYWTVDHKALRAWSPDASE
jgi:hypothetical protein